MMPWQSSSSGSHPAPDVTPTASSTVLLSEQSHEPSSLRKPFRLSRRFAPAKLMGEAGRPMMPFVSSQSQSLLLTSPSELKARARAAPAAAPWPRLPTAAPPATTAVLVFFTATPPAAARPRVSSEEQSHEPSSLRKPFRLSRRFAPAKLMGEAGRPTMPFVSSQSQL